jgi:UDP-N-acetylmuramate dehydrogenase
MTGPLEEAGALLSAACGDRLRRSFVLAPLTTFRIGGRAALYLEAGSDADLAAVARAVSATGLPWAVIGKGSNVLVSDRGYAGLVIRLGKAYRWAARDGARLAAGGSMPLPALAGVALSHGLSGLEFGVAIPASLGGAVWMNAGAHHHAMDEVVDAVEVFRIPEGVVETVPGDLAGFSYRRSNLPPGVVVGAGVTLRSGDRGAIREEMEAARSWRKATQPLAEPNCGSVFKNPPGDHAARLVEAAGAKGLAEGGATVSTKHANFIVAAPGTTAEEVRRLIQRVQQQVQDRFHVTLEPEVQFVGDFDQSR